MNISALASTVIILFGSVAALILGKSILVPFMLALLIYFLIRAIHRFIDKNSMIRVLVPSWVKNILSAVLIFTFLGVITNLLIVNAEHLILSFSEYQGNLEKVMESMRLEFGIDLVKTATDKFNNINFTSLANTVFNSVTGFLGSMLMVFFYVIFLFIEEGAFRTKLRLLFRGDRFKKIEETLENMESSITHYIGLKSLIALISGVCCYIVCLSFGISSPLFWAFLISICNFIPVIGALAGVFMPAVFSIIQFGEFVTPLVFLLILGTLQTLISNFFEPWLMGDSLNISPLVALLSLVFWGAIWGIVGMIVSIPVTVILIILLAQLPKTKSIAILLSLKGKI